VNALKFKWLFLIILVVIFSGGRIAMANGGNPMIPSTAHHNENEHSENSMEGMDMNGKDKNMDMSGSKKGDNMEGMNMGGNSSEPLKETPANLKVLGTYGAVNLSFIVIGVWNKWFRRKGGFDGNSK
jgi:hypothetical protein